MAVQVACELELWQEAFRSVEDIQGLIVMGKKPIKTQMMAVYYAKLAKIFTVSESHLYNGCALIHSINEIEALHQPTSNAVTYKIHSQTS